MKRYVRVAGPSDFLEGLRLVSRYAQIIKMWRADNRGDESSGWRGRIARPYRENVSMIASAIASAYSSSTKWPPSK